MPLEKGGTMIRKAALLGIIFSVLVFKTGFGQVPRNGATLNRTQVMLEYAFVPGAVYYQLQIWESGTTKLVYSATDKSTAHLVSSGLAFGKTYNWISAAFTNKHSSMSVSDTMHFTIATHPLVTKYRFSVAPNDERTVSPGLLVTDYGVTINRKGEVVFYQDTLWENIRHCRLNRDGNITYVATDRAVEFNLDGKLLWKSDTVRRGDFLIADYHHQVHKLADGTYLCLALKKSNLTERKKELIVELDSMNRVIRLWEEEKFFTAIEPSLATHINSIALSADSNFYLISCRDISSLIKLNRYTGKPVYSIGMKVSDSAQFIPHNAFALQHSACYYNNKNIVFLNNGNPRKSSAVSSVLIIKEPVSKDTSLQLVWEYKFNFPVQEDNYSSKTGSVSTMPNGNIFVAQGSRPRNFEIDRSGKIVWEELTEQKANNSDNWIKAGSYSVQFVSSLYPCYFTVIKPDEKTMVLTNEGTENDSYRVQLVNEDGTQKWERIFSVKSGRSHTFSLKEGEKKLRLIICSMNNPKLRKQFN